MGIPRDGYVSELAVNRSDGAFPATERLFEIQVNGVDEVIAVAGIERVWFLYSDVS
jgi:hypothetical protein